jgi:ATP/maltotriose-dependent transcriptional regulator MalT
MINIAASTAYYEEDASIEERLNGLKAMADRGIYPHLALAAFYVKQGQLKNASLTLKDCYKRYGKIHYKIEYIPLAHHVLKPFCELSANQECLKLISPFITKPQSLSYR